MPGYKAYITTYNKQLARHYFLRGVINDRVSKGIDNKLNETYYTNYHLEFVSAKTCLWFKAITAR